jgi:hypothetical protein
VFGVCSNGISRKDTDEIRTIENTDFSIGAPES